MFGIPNKIKLGITMETENRGARLHTLNFKGFLCRRAVYSVFQKEIFVR